MTLSEAIMIGIALLQLFFPTPLDYIRSKKKNACGNRRSRGHTDEE